MTGSAFPLELAVDDVIATVAATAQWLLVALIAVIVIVLLHRSLAEQGES